LSCHEGPDDIGKLDLGAHAFPEEAQAEPDLYWSAAFKVWDRSMPPPRKRKQPSAEERAAFLAWVDSDEGLDRTPAEARAGLRRLNRSQYLRSIRMLFNVELPDDMLTDLPEDESGDGFDNIGASLTMSDQAFIRYLELAEYIAEQAIRVPLDGLPQQHFLGSELQSNSKSGTNAALWTRGDAFRDVFVKHPGRYRLKVGAWGNQAGKEDCRMSLVVDHETILKVSVPNDASEEGVFSTELALDKGRHRLTARFLNDYYNPKAPQGQAKDRNLYISWMKLEGPLDPPQPSQFQQWLFENQATSQADSGEKEAAGYLIRKLIHHAWRRLPTRGEMESYQDLWNRQHGSKEEKVQSILIAALVSPHFLFEPEGNDGIDLATRISLFLWSSYPDGQLIEAASDPAWSENPQAIRQQVERMLMDPRADAIAEDFASQCFRIRGLRNHEIDPVQFPGIEKSTIDSMMQETTRFFMHNLRQGHDLNELLTAEHSFMNRQLAHHYGLEWHGDDEEWQEIDLSETNRRGLLGHASILTVTSLPTRTAPVRRGKWIMENLLGTEPPPPPNDAGQLDESPQVVASAPLRQRLAAHRDNPDCISCHMVMDPLGFSLEHFDAVGRWREVDGAFQVDAGGQLPDGTEITGLKDLVEVIDARASFSRLLVSRLASYALGRTLVPGDRPLIQSILNQLDPRNPSLKDAIQAIVASEAFRTPTP
jgi:hypothetical protein